MPDVYFVDGYEVSPTDNAPTESTDPEWAPIDPETGEVAS